MNTVPKLAISRIKEKVTENDKEECDRIMEGVRINILGKCTSTKETEKGTVEYTQCRF